MTDASTPVACTLTTKQAATQVLEWQDLQGHATAIQALEHGAAMTFPLSLLDQVEALAERERACCAFLAITTLHRSDDFDLVVTSPNPDAMPVIQLLAGLSDA